MPTVALRFTFKPNEKINHLLDACGQMTQQAVEWALDNRKTSTHTIVKALYPTFREQFPKLHSCWAQKAARTAAAIVHAFQRRQRKRRRKEEGGRRERRRQGKWTASNQKGLGLRGQEHFPLGVGRGVLNGSD